MVQSADLVLDTASTNLRLMLARNRGVRQWARKRMPRRPTISGEAPIEVTYEWRSWHEGDGLSRIRDPRPGLQVPRTEYGTCTTIYPGKIMPAAKSSTVSINPNTGLVNVVFGLGSGAFIVGPTGVYLSYTYATDAWAVAGTNVLHATAVPTDSAYFKAEQYIATEGQQAWKVTAGGVWTASGAGAAFQWAYTGFLNGKFYFTTATNNPNMKFVNPSGSPFTSGDHSAAISLTGHYVTGLNQLGRSIYFMTDRGPGFLDLDLNTVMPVPELNGLFEFGNNRSTQSWHGGLIIPSSIGVFWYTEGMIAPIGPEILTENEYENLNGYATSLTADSNWVYMVTSTGLVLAGRERTAQDSPGPAFCWFHIESASAVFATACAIANPVGTLRRFLFFPDSSATVAKFIHIPFDASSTAYSRDGAFFTTSSSIKVLPRIYVGQPGVTATLKSIEIDLEDADANNSVQVAYDLDNSGSFTNLGSAVTSNGRTELPFTAGTNAREAQIRVTLTHNGTDAPVTVRRIALNVAERPRKTSIWSAVARIGYGVTDRNGSEMPGDPDEIMTTLYAWEVSGSALAITDPGGVARNVIILNVEDTEAEDEDESHDSKRLVTITMQEV